MRSFGSGFLLSLSVCLDLGLVNLAILRTALQRGGRAAFLVGLGSCVGDMTYFVLAAVGIAALVASFPPVRWALWLGGSALLAFLAARMIREVVRPRHVAVTAATATPASRARLFSWGASLALASPTSILWFAAVGGSVIATFAGDRTQLLPFAAGFAAAGVVWSAALAFGADALRKVAGHKLVRALSLVSAVLFVYFAVVVFVRGLRDLT